MEWLTLSRHGGEHRLAGLLHPLRHILQDLLQTVGIKGESRQQLPGIRPVLTGQLLPDALPQQRLQPPAHRVTKRLAHQEAAEKRRSHADHAGKALHQAPLGSQPHKPTNTAASMASMTHVIRISPYLSDRSYGRYRLAADAPVSTADPSLRISTVPAALTSFSTAYSCKSLS